MILYCKAIFAYVSMGQGDHVRHAMTEKLFSEAWVRMGVGERGEREGRAHLALSARAS